MARSTKRSAKTEQVRDYVEGVAKNLVDKLYGPDGPPGAPPSRTLRTSSWRSARF